MTLADELREVAFAAPPKEAFLEVDLSDVQELFEKDDRQELANYGIEGCPQIRSGIELEGPEYQGILTSRKQTFSESSEDQEQDSISSTSSLSFNQEETKSEGSDLYEKYNHLMDDVGLSELRKGVVKDRERGLAVQRDQKRWNECLEMRVTLQKSLTNAHKLPPISPLTQILTSDPTLTTKKTELVEFSSSLLKQLLELESQRLSNKKRKEADFVRSSYGELWDVMESQYSVLSEFRNASLDRYHRQAMLQSGASTKKGNLRILHQGISSQVQSILQFPNKALMKAKMPFSEQSKVISMAHPPGTQEGLNGEIYNDLEFYQGLLNEYLTNQGKFSVPAVTRRKKLKTGQSGKRMKALFTDIQDKLVNFMSPVETEEPEFAKQLFQNLFGI